ncbi:hypothetical protein ES703_79085 [subsurface metagenome]
MQFAEYCLVGEESSGSACGFGVTDDFYISPGNSPLIFLTVELSLACNVNFEPG